MRKTCSWRTLVGALLVFAVAGLPTCSPSRRVEQPDIILIVIDALRAGNLGCYGHFRNTSPNIDALAGSGTLFETAITQAPWTKASFASFLTSRYPFQHGIKDWTGMLPDSIETLAEVLRREGYGTMCIINMIAMSDRFQVLKGFEIINEAGKGGWGASRTTDEALELIAGTEGPFFLLVHYFDPHAPYAPPIQYADLVRNPSDPDPVSVPRDKRGGGGIPSREAIDRNLLLYDGCIRFVDDNIGRLLAYLDENGARERTAIIVTSDHGEEFYEHGVSGHGANVYDYAIKVPLIVNFTGEFEGGARVLNQTRLVDIFPTVLELAGIECGDAVEGYSLVGLADKGKWPEQGHRLLPPQIALSECSVRRTLGTKCLRTDSYKTIVEPLTSLVEVYNLREDPEEKNDLWPARREIGEALLERLKQVPDISLGGWRLAFTGGDGDTRVRVMARISGEGRFTNLQRLTRGGDLSIDANSDSTALMVETSLDRLHLVLFETLPEDAALSLEIGGSGPSFPDRVHLGIDAGHDIGGGMHIDRDAALGLPADFSANRRDGVAAVYAWWLPGRSHRETAADINLTPEETSRLRALGYLQ